MQAQVRKEKRSEAMEEKEEKWGMDRKRNEGEGYEGNIEKEREY